jgi:hypothetical protein
MFNEYIKLQFIDTLVNTEVAKHAFKTSESYEDAYQKDLFDFNQAECQAYQSKLFESFSYESRRKYRQILTKYAKWCIKQGYTTSDFSKYINQQKSYNSGTIWVSTPMMLKLRMDATFYPHSMMTADAAKRCFIWMAYLGIPKERVMSIKDQDIHLGDSPYIAVDDMMYKIIDEAIEDFNICLNSTGYKVIGNIGQLSSVLPKKDTDYFLRTNRISVPSYWQYNNTLLHKAERNKVKFTLNYQYIFECGSFYRAYLREKDGEPLDLSECCVARLRVKKEPTAPLIKMVIADYNCWKEEFNLK